MMHKMWVRKSGEWWEVGCQCCGRLIHENWSFRHAWRVAELHIHRHEVGFYDSGY